MSKTKNEMRTIIKNNDGTFWVRYCGMYVGTFTTYEEAKKCAMTFTPDLS